MAVDSYLELFTTLYGWHWYGIIWDVLASTGIVLIPFIIILIKTWKDAARGGNYGNVHELALRGMELEFYIAIFVAIIAGAPAVTLNATMLSYQAPPNVVEPAPPIATVASSKSTYGNPGAFSGAPGSVKLPIWWYTVLALSKGVNHAIMAGIPNTANLRLIREQAKTVSITDPVVRDEATQFYSECFIPARAKYLREKPSSAAVTSLLKNYGEDDPDWMGSHVLRKLYYSNMRSMRQVAGWPYDASRDKDFDPALPHKWGRPTCEQWWADSSNGLRSKITSLKEASTLENTLGKFNTWLSGFLPPAADAAEKNRDRSAKIALENSLVDKYAQYQPDTLGAYNSDGFVDSAYKALQSATGTLGAAAENFTLGAMLMALKPMLPIIQAILLMIVYALLPLVVVLSGYSLSMIVMAAIGLFTINFWSVLWKLAQWIDDNLLLSMFDGVDAIDQIMGALSNDAIFGSITKDLLIDLLLASLMIGMPLIFTMVMAWAGLHIVRGISGALDQTLANSGAKNVGTSGTRSAGKIAKKAGKGGGSGKGEG